MAVLEITTQAKGMSSKTPHKIYINGHFTCIMKSKSIFLSGLPIGNCTLVIQSMFPFISSTFNAHIREGENIVIFKDRERFWDTLCYIDIFCMILQLFIKLPPIIHKWYSIITNGYFILWLLYEWIIRKKYFRINQVK